MPTVLGRPYSLFWGGDPPHMLQPDIPIWREFQARYSAFWSALYMDCKLGGPYYTPEQLADPMIKMWRDVLVKRADAIAELEDEVWIIEVSADPGLRAIGQLLTYQTLWIRDPPIQKPEKLVLVCHTIETDLLDAAGMRSLQVYIV